MGWCQGGLSSWWKEPENLWEFLVSRVKKKNPPKRNKLCSSILPPHTMDYRRKLAFNINLSLPFSLWVIPAFTLSLAGTPLIHKARSAPRSTETWYFALTLMYTTRFGRVQLSYLCLTKTVTWYIATYSLCGVARVIQSEQGSRRETKWVPTPVKRTK